jgi:hypothetical protein
MQPAIATEIGSDETQWTYHRKWRDCTAVPYLDLQLRGKERHTLGTCRHRLSLMVLPKNKRRELTLRSYDSCSEQKLPNKHRKT